VTGDRIASNGVCLGHRATSSTRLACPRVCAYADKPGVMPCSWRGLSVLSSPLPRPTDGPADPVSAQTATRRHSTNHKDGRHRHPSRRRYGLGTSDPAPTPLTFLHGQGLTRTERPYAGRPFGLDSLMDGRLRSDLGVGARCDSRSDERSSSARRSRGLEPETPGAGQVRSATKVKRSEDVGPSAHP
jgi:hypothetical protein